MPTILITGAASGVGAAVLQAYEHDPENSIVAIDRVNVDTSNSRVQCPAVDVSSQDSINTFADGIQGKPIDLVIHSAGSAYAYRASKAALNTIVRSFDADVSDVCFVMCHPGRVETNLVRSREAGAITAEESVNEIIPLITK